MASGLISSYFKQLMEPSTSKTASATSLAARDAVLAQGTLKFIHADVFFRHVSGDHFAVVHQQAGLTLNEFSKAAIAARKLRHQIIQHQQGRGSHYAAQQRGVWTGHGVLHCVADQQQESEVEGGHLTHFPFAAQANPHQDDGVNHRRPQRNLAEYVPAGKHAELFAGGHGSGCVLGCAEIASGLLLVHRPHH